MKETGIDGDNWCPYGAPTNINPLLAIAVLLILGVFL